ncbi:MAG: RNA polymerase sigma factor RpoD/SigA [Deltaproteobacteria bacterium]|nr:MAG: RNA polymerase sigma factor RpoD/SigA [Deltaproteobacteria bacterium]
MERLKDEQQEPATFDRDEFKVEKLYMRDLRKLPIISWEEEQEYAHRIAQGDLQARKKMIEANLRLVVKIARRYANEGISTLDLIEEGNLGLIRAVEKFDPSKECRFSTYATWWIKQAIERAVANFSRTIRIPIHVSTKIYKLSRQINLYYEKHGREPAIEELAVDTGLQPDAIRNLLSMITRTYSLETIIDDEGKLTLEEVLPSTSGDDEPFVAFEHARRAEEIASWLDTLTTDEKKVVIMRFGLDGGDPQTLESIGKVFGVTRERIRQIEQKAINKLRRVVKRKNIGTEAI